MKRSTKTLLIIAAVCIVIGIIFSAIAISLSGGILNLLQTNLHYERQETPIALNGETRFLYEGNSRSITLLPSEDDNIHITYYESQKDEFSLSKIAEDAIIFAHEERAIFDIGIASKEVYEIIIYLPAAITDVEIHATSGHVELSKLSLDAVSIQTSSGDIELKETTVQTLASLDTQSGAVYVKHAEALQSMQIQTKSGNVKIQYHVRNTPHHYSCRTGSGTIRMEEKNYKNEALTDEMKASLAAISTASGNITVLHQWVDS